MWFISHSKCLREYSFVFCSFFLLQNLWRYFKMCLKYKFIVFVCLCSCAQITAIAICIWNVKKNVWKLKILSTDKQSNCISHVIPTSLSLTNRNLNRIEDRAVEHDFHHVNKDFVNDRRIFLKAFDFNAKQLITDTSFVEWLSTSYRVNSNERKKNQITSVISHPKLIYSSRNMVLFLHSQAMICNWLTWKCIQ